MFPQLRNKLKRLRFRLPFALAALSGLVVPALTRFEPRREVAVEAVHCAALVSGRLELGCVETDRVLRTTRAAHIRAVG
jgi:hypothetical protein